VKLDAKIRDLEARLLEKGKDSVKMKMMTDDLKAKDEQIHMLNEMLASLS